MRHGVEGAVEALRDALGLSLLEDRREQHVAHGVGVAVDGQQEGRRQQAERDVIEVAAQDEAERHRAGQRDDQDDHHARRAVVSPGDAGGRRQRYADRRRLGEAVLDDVDGIEAEQAERQPVHGAVGDVGVLAPARFLARHQRRQRGILAHVEHAHDADADHAGDEGAEGHVAGVGPHQADQRCLRRNADGKGEAVAEKRFHERNIDVDRQVLFSFCSHDDFRCGSQ